MNAFAWFVAFLAPTFLAAAAPAEKPPVTLTVTAFVEREPSVERGHLRLAGRLAAERAIIVLEQRGAAALFKEKGQSAAGKTDAPGTNQKKPPLSARYIVSGTFLSKNDEVALEIRLQDAAAQEPLWNASVRGKATELPALVDRLAADLLKHLGIEPTKQTVQTALPADPKKVWKVAVLGFENYSSDPEMGGADQGFILLLESALKGSSQIQVVERNRSLEASLNDSPKAAKGAKPEPESGNSAGADRLIVGSVTDLGKTMHLEARLVDVDTTVVMASARASGGEDKFEDMVRGLAKEMALSVGRSPAVAPGPTMDKQRRQEIALQLKQAEESVAAGKPAEAIGHLERVLLLDSKNLSAFRDRQQLLRTLGEQGKRVEAARLMFAQDFDPEERIKRRMIGVELANALYDGGKKEEARALAEKMIAENKGAPDVFTPNYQNVLMMIQYFEKTLRPDLAGFEKKLADPALKKNAFVFDRHIGQMIDAYRNYIFSQAKGQSWPDQNTVGPLYQRIGELVDLMLDAYAQRGPVKRPLRSTLVTEATFNAAYGPGPEEWMIPRRTADDRVRRILQLAGATDPVRRPALEYLAGRALAEKKRPEAIALYRQLLPLSQPSPKLIVQYLPEFNLLTRQSSAQQFSAPIIESRIVQLESLTGESKEKVSAAAADYFRHYGFLQSEGAALFRTLEERDVEAVLSDRAVLIWGGGDFTRRSWERFLSKSDRRVHGMNLVSLPPGALESYGLVVLALQHPTVFSPSEILALRSYVARGGSLFVIVSPSWSPAAPGLVNPILSFFGVKAKGEFVRELNASVVREHPITAGAKNVLARGAVHLECAPELALASGNGKTVLAAGKYRMGKFVVASIGQWTIPDHDIQLRYLSAQTEYGEPKKTTQDLPVETGTRLEQALLGRAVNWLTEGSDDAKRRAASDYSFARLALSATLGLPKEEKLATARESLLQKIGKEEADEELLWLAAESAWPYYLANYRGNEVGPGTPKQAKMRRATEELYQRLLWDFPKSPMAPYADWRRVESVRRNVIFETITPLEEYFLPASTAVTLFPEGIDLYAKLSAPKGSYAWAWGRLRLASEHLANKQYEEAATAAQEIAEAMDVGPEKLSAIVTLAGARKELGQTDLAKKTFQRLLELPMLYWTFGDSIEQICPIVVARQTSRYCTMLTHREETYWLRDASRSAAPIDPNR